MLKTKDPRGELGKWGEKQVGKWLEARSTSEAGFAYHRYPDARAARGALPAQPADFLVAYRTPLRSSAIHLEVKETAQKTRLPRAKVSQFGKLQMFHWAGFRTLIVVYRSLFNDWTYFVPHDLFTTEEPPASFPFVEGRSFPTAEALLDSLFVPNHSYPISC
jgi:hypothetical protein